MSRKRRSRRSRAHIILAVLGALAALVVAAFALVAVAAAALLADYTRDLPKLTKTSLPRPEQTTKLYASDGHLLTSLYVDQNRVLLPLKKIPLHTRRAIVDIEDHRFWEHQGVDTKAIARAIRANLTSGQLLEGGSTITQQYVRNGVISPERTLRRKIREALLAYRLEQVLSKTEILERYLNTVYFGQSAYGVEAAAVTYFGKHAGKLSLAESALLAGLIKSPNRLSPHTNLQGARTARNRVLAMMLRLGHISKAQYEQAIRSRVKVSPPRQPSSVAPYFTDHVKQRLIERYGADTVFRGGLRVKTTIDLRMQREAERAWRAVLGRPGDPSVAVVALDPRNGAIRALVGGRDFRSSKYNLATQAHRQPGSAFKPFVLAAALEEGVSPGKKYPSGPVRIRLPGGGTWNVDNATEGSGGPPMTLRDATIDSVNGVFARLIMDVGADKVVTSASELGIKTPLAGNPAMALGGLPHGVTPLEMASAYGSFANGGQWLAPWAVVSVTDSSGNTLESPTPVGRQAIRPQTAAVITDILRGVIREGTGTEAEIGRPAAGKTGTTQQYRDAWFVGYTPELSVAVWVGYPDVERAMTNVRGVAVRGGTFPARIWARFMIAALSRTSATAFADARRGLVKVKVCSESALLPNEYCPSVTIAEFVRGAQPSNACNLHGPSGKNPVEVKVPYVIGLTKQAAQRQLERMGLKVSVQYRQEDPGGVVLAQSPVASSVVAQGSMIYLTISRATTPNRAPAARFTFAPSSPAAREPVDFNASSSWDADGDMRSYQWSFGDGSYGEGEAVSHAYGHIGTYSVTLTVSDYAGNATSVTRQIAVRP